MAEDVAGQGHIPCNERINVEEASEAEVMMLRDDFLRFANDNFGTATVTILTKDYANEFKEISSPLPSIDFQEQLQNTGPLLKIYIREWLAGSAVVLVL